MFKVNKAFAKGKLDKQGIAAYAACECYLSSQSRPIPLGLLVDACRNDPASRLFLDAAKGPGLASVTLPQVTPLPEGVVALFSCAEGQQTLLSMPRPS